MRIALIGSTGQLGTDLGRTLRDEQHEVIDFGHSSLEITNASDLMAKLDAHSPQCVVNCAAYNLVDRAEDEPELAFAVNGLGPRNLAKLCADRQWTLMHISSDYVFGSESTASTPLTELNVPSPNSAYSLSKLAGEYFVRAECPRHFVVRTCGLYGHAALLGKGKGNFVETMLRLGRERKQLRVVDDQHCTPTATMDLANALTRLLTTDAFGLYHATNSGRTTWCELAREIFRVSQMEVEVIPITTSEFGAKARRPHFSVLDCSKLTAVIGSPLPDWHDAVARYLVERT